MKPILYQLHPPPSNELVIGERLVKRWCCSLQDMNSLKIPDPCFNPLTLFTILSVFLVEILAKNRSSRFIRSEKASLFPLLQFNSYRPWGAEFTIPKEKGISQLR